MNEAIKEIVVTTGKSTAKALLATKIGPFLAGTLVDGVAVAFKSRINSVKDSIVEALDALETDGKINLEDLKNDPVFDSILITTLTIAPRIHQQERINFLVNAISNAAIKVDVEEDLQYIFLDYIEKLTLTHVMLLEFFIENETKYRNVQSYEELYGDFINFFYQKNSAGLMFDSRDQFKLYCNALAGYSLIKFGDGISDFKDVYEVAHLIAESSDSEHLPRIKVTEVGKKFKLFISKNADK